MPHRRPRKVLLGREKFRYNMFLLCTVPFMERHKHTYAIPFIPIVPVPVPMRKDGRHYPKKMEEIRGSRFFLPPTTSRHVTSRAINETYDCGQFYYSTRHAKKNMIFIITNSKPLYNICIRVTTKKAHIHSNTNTNTNTKYAGRTIPFLFRNYIIHHAFTH